jgi:hypothetical protein
MKTVPQCVDFLNEALALDPVAISELFLHQFPCNEKFADHPTIQVSSDCTFGAFGVLNGLFGTIGGTGVGHMFYEVEEVNGKRVITKFGLVGDPNKFLGKE